MVSMDYFEPHILEAGLEYRSFGSRAEYDAVGANPDIWKPFKGTKLVFEIAQKASRAAYETITKVIQERAGNPITLIAPGTNFGARMVREKTGLRLITAHLQPISMLSAYDFPVFHTYLVWMRRLPLWLRKLMFRVPNIMDLLLRRKLGPMCRELGIAMPLRPSREWWHSPDANLALFPAWFAAPQPDWPTNTYQHTFPLEDLGKEQGLSPELMSFLSAGPPPLVFTAGTANQHAREFFTQAVAAAKATGQRAILATRHTPDVPASLPETIIAQSYVPFSRVLPHCRCLIHHGGIGTMSQALAAGIPQLITPLAHDQPDNAWRIQQLGLGDYLLPSKLTAQTLGDSLQKVLSLPVEPLHAARQRLLADHHADQLIRWLTGS